MSFAQLQLDAFTALKDSTELRLLLLYVMLVPLVAAIAQELVFAECVKVELTSTQLEDALLALLLIVQHAVILPCNVKFVLLDIHFKEPFV